MHEIRLVIKPYLIRKRINKLGTRHNIKTEKLKSLYRYKLHEEKYCTSKNKKLKVFQLTNFFLLFTSNFLKMYCD